MFGNVAKFRRRRDRKLVSIKRVSREHYSMCIREIRVLDALTDKAENHIVRLYEAFVDQHFFYIVQQAMDQNLYEFQKSNGLNKLEVCDIRTIILQLLLALAKLKDMGIVHTDIKEETIMLVNQRRQPFRVKLIDFGSYYTIHDLASMWTPDIQPRCVRAPEVILGVPGCNAKVDMWSLGCVMGQMALGRSLFPSKCELELLHAIFGTRGLPSARMLDAGIKTRMFFDRTQIGRDAYEWNLRPWNGRELASGTKSLRRRVPAKLDSLDAIEGVEHGFQGDDAVEVADRKCMVELLDRMLTLEPDQRITPNQALLHPFVTLQHLSGCERYHEYYNFSLQRYREAGVTLPQAPLFRHEDSSEETVPGATQEVPKRKRTSLRRSLRSFFTRLFTRRRKKQPVVAQGAKDSLSLEDSAVPEDMPANTAGTSRAARKSMKKEKGSKTEPASSSGGSESSTPLSSSLEVPERTEEPPKKKGFLRRWLQTLSGSFGGCRGKKSVTTQDSNETLAPTQTPRCRTLYILVLRHSLTVAWSCHSAPGARTSPHGYAFLYSLQFLISAV
ncbi:hypothetical protein SKAU_G00001760 [Synaphobranchus kaupii]|uniref:Protein kinase domain-containing protein n=1 Tax=Synaphobranchus kaupii TaxID=118154 RepID=A0A9Q1G9B9_SYNKA|nr:hypothetical protein SKAU_G00001760 [Synaphobranchus kaupii]